MNPISPKQEELTEKFISDVNFAVMSYIEEMQKTDATVCEILDTISQALSVMVGETEGMHAESDAKKVGITSLNKAEVMELANRIQKTIVADALVGLENILSTGGHCTLAKAYALPELPAKPKTTPSNTFDDDGDEGNGATFH